MVAINRGMLKPGDVLAGGKYQIVEEVGSGAMGTVYRALHTVLDRQVAIKVLNPLLITVSNAEARFLREAKAASKIQHRNSVQILDYGSEGDWLYIVMELLEGRELKDIIELEAPLHKTRVAEIMTQVCSALSAAHEVGVIHRDLKPANIMVVSDRDDDGNEIQSVKVCDFGIAKVQTSGGESSGDSLDLTATGMITGTPAYMSPEQAKGKKLDARSDLYSCGVLMYIMATGELPFNADSPLGYLTQHVSDAPPLPSKSNPNISKSLESIIKKCLNKDPKTRYQNAKKLRQDLIMLQSEGSAEQLRVEPEPQSANDWTWGAAGLPLPDDRETNPTTKTVRTEVVPVTPSKRPWMVIAGFVLAFVLGSFFFFSSYTSDSEDEEVDTASEEPPERPKRTRFPAVPAASSAADDLPGALPEIDIGESEAEDQGSFASGRNAHKKGNNGIKARGEKPPEGGEAGSKSESAESFADPPEEESAEQSPEQAPGDPSGESGQGESSEDTDLSASPTDLPDKEPEGVSPSADEL